MDQHRRLLVVAHSILACLSLAVAGQGEAHAEEKLWFVRDLQLFETGGEPLLVGETGFGAVMRSAETGQWSLVCATALGLPALTLTGHSHSVLVRADGRGRLLALSTSGLFRADQATCGWKPLLEVTRELTPLAVASWPAAPDRLWVLGGYRGRDGEGPQTRILVSEDGGRTFQPRGALPSPWIGLSLVMPGWDAPVLFVRARHPGTDVQAFFRSADGGATWQTIVPVPAVPGADGFWPILLAAARKPGVLYFLVNGKEPGAADELWISRDAGASATRALVVADGGLVTALYADPRSDDLLVTALTEGPGPDRGALYVSRDAGVTFEPPVRSPVRFNCIKKWQGKLLACQHNQQDPQADFDVGVSEDGGRSWRPLYKLIDTTAPVGCLREACRADYQFVKDQVTPATLPPDDPPDAGMASTDSAPAPVAPARGQGQGGCAFAARSPAEVSGVAMAILAALGMAFGRRSSRLGTAARKQARTFFVVTLALAGVTLLASGGCGSAAQPPPMTMPDAAADQGPDLLPGFASLPDGWAAEPDAPLSSDPPDANIRPYPDARPRPLPPGVDLALPRPQPDVGELVPALDAAVDRTRVPQACAALAHCCPRVHSVPELIQSCAAQAAAGNEDDCSAVVESPWDALRSCYQEFLMTRDR